MKKLKLLLLIAGTLCMWQLKAQTGASCLTTKSLTLTPTQSTGWQTTALDTIWYEFSATHQNQIYEVSTNIHFVKHIKYALASTGCSLSNITDGGIKQNDSTFMISFSNLTIGQAYKMLLISKNFSSCLFCSTSVFSNYNITFVSAPLSTISSCSSINTCLISPPCDLICNGNFETISSPPSLPTDFSYLCNWDNLGGTCDMYNNGGSSYYEVPCNYIGSEADIIIGNHGYVGFIGYAAFGLSTWIESTGTTLKTPMIAGHSYQISFKLSLGDDSQFFTDNVGIEVSGGAVSFPSPTFFNMSGLSKNGWTTYSTIYNSVGGEDYLTLGAFNTGVMPSTPVKHPYTGVTLSSSCFGFTHPDISGANGAYYYLDEVSVLEVGSLSVTPFQQTICQGGSANINIVSPIPGEVYTWSPAGSVLSGQGTPNVVVNPTSNTIFTVTTSAGGCLNTANAYVYVLNTPPTILLTASPNPVCQNQAITFTATTISGFPYSYPTYTWDAPIGVSTSSIVSITPTGSGLFTYNVTGSDTLANCFTSTSINVQVDKNPSFTIIPSTICYGELITATITDVTTMLGIQPYTIDWGFGIQNYYSSSTQSFLYPTPGVYVVSFTGINGACNSSITQTVNVLDLKPQFDISSINCQNLSVCFNNTSNCILPASQWLWTVTGAGGFIQTATSLNLCQNFPAVGIYTICLQQDNGFGMSSANCQTIAVTAPTPIVITNTLLSLCNLPVDGLLTLDPNITLGPTGYSNWNAYNQITGSALVLPYTTGINGIITYDLTGFSTYTDPIGFCINASINGCDANQCITIYPCCPTVTGTVVYNNTTFTTNTTLSGPTNYHFSGVITISSGVNLSILGANISFDPNAKIVVNNNSKLISSLSYFHACGAMWDGVYLSNSSELVIDQCTIEDAKRSFIDTLGATSITIENSWFNKNYEGIVLKAINTTQKLTIWKNIFSCNIIPAINTVAPVPAWYGVIAEPTIGALPAAFLLPPYSTQKSYSGITLYQTKTPSNPSQFVQIDKYNLFDKLKFGIVATRSRFVVQYNTFQNITAGKGLYAAIYIYGKTGVYPPYLPEAKIGGTPLEGNTFSNCTYGIYNQYGSILSILNNTLTTINRDGIFITKNIYNVVIDKNKLNQCLRGINLFDNGRIKADVTNNRIVNATTVGIYNNNYGIFVGEVIPATSASSIINRYHNIYNNYIEGYYNGMYVSNTYSTQIEDNEAHIRADNTSGNFQMGIRVEGTNKINIKNNIVDKPLADNSAWWQYGIFLDGNTIPAIKCNSINNFYASVKFQMLNYVAPGNGLIFNSFSNYNHAIWLDQNAEIGDQYFSFLIGINNASMNQWLTPPPPLGSQTYASNFSNQTIASGMPGASRIFTSASGSYYLNNLFALDNFISNKLLRGVGYSPIYIACPPSIPSPLMFRSANIALNNLSYGINTTNLLHVGNRMLVKNLKTECINLSLPTNAMYKNFIDSTYNKSVGQFYRVDSLLNLGMSTGSLSTISQAKLLNTSISAPNLLEQNQKWLNATYIDMQTTEPDSTILLMLEQLAIKCPQYDGEAVYQARSLLMYYFGKSYNSICDALNIQPSGSRLSNMTDTDSSPLGRSGGASVFPNPTNKDITVIYTKGVDGEAAVFEVYNILGELVLNQTLYENKTTLSLNDLSSGIYIYFIKQDGITLQTNKLVLTK